MAGDTKKGGKGSPKLKRAGRLKNKYARQFARTFKNKMRRVRHSNGEAAAAAYASRFAPALRSESGPGTLVLPRDVAGKAKKHSVKR